MQKNNSKKTTISLSEATKQQLDAFTNQKSESYDEILQRVISNANTLCSKKSDNDDVVSDEEVQ